VRLPGGRCLFAVAATFFLFLLPLLQVFLELIALLSISSRRFSSFSCAFLAPPQLSGASARIGRLRALVDVVLGLWLR
jgi:hypothetical protein